LNGSVDLYDVIGLAYEAVLAPQRWPEVLETAANVLGGDGAALHVQDQITGKGWGMVARVDPAAVTPYFGHFATRNPIRHRRNSLLRLSDGGGVWRRRPVTDEHALPKPELMRSEYYNDFLRPFGIHSLLMLGLSLEKTKFASINFLRPPHRSQFDDRDVDLAALLQPHLVRAFELSRRLSGLEQLDDGLAQSLDRSPNGVFLVDDEGRVRYANRAAEALAAKVPGLSIRNGILHAGSADATRKLLRMIVAAASADREKRTGGAMSVARPGHSRPLSVVVVPLYPEHVTPFGPQPPVIVCVADMEARRAVPGDRLRDLFGLTPAEVTVAVELLAGGDPAAIADRLSLSVHTVRVHLARIKLKTDTSKQSELVRLLERASSICADPLPRAP
jgi:DNA-binding CsgD family transcriptional regulator/PAS domain-containing protein